MPGTLSRTFERRTLFDLRLLEEPQEFGDPLVVFQCTGSGRIQDQRDRLVVVQALRRLADMLDGASPMGFIEPYSISKARDEVGT